MYVRLAYLGLPPAVSHLSKTSVVKLCIKSVPTSTEDQHTDYGSVFFLSMDEKQYIVARQRYMYGRSDLRLIAKVHRQEQKR